MKKEYEKPVIELVEFEMNDAIAGCPTDATEGFVDIKCVKGQYVDIAFTESDGCFPTEGYCYYNSTGIVLFQS